MREVVDYLEYDKSGVFGLNQMKAGWSEVIEKINQYFHFMDDKYYSELEGKPDDMKELTELLDKKEIGLTQKEDQSITSDNNGYAN